MAVWHWRCRWCTPAVSTVGVASRDSRDAFNGAILVSRQPIMERAADFRDFANIWAAGNLPFTPQTIEHIYIRLDFKPEFENAGNADDARRFLRSVFRAAKGAHDLAGQYNGILLEVQGSVLHVGLLHPAGFAENAHSQNAIAYVADLHRIYKQIIFDDRSMRVDGWRMTIDAGKTLVVQGRGVHGDDSFVSLGASANRPAKHLYSQLEIRREEDRELKQFYVAIHDPRNKQWSHKHLEELPTQLNESAADSIGVGAREAEPTLHYTEAIQSKMAFADAAPIDPAGTPSSPTPDRPNTYFGWVMRSDLDGFTRRVEQCFDNDTKLQGLALEFYRIMDAARDFTDRHNQTLAQLPWAGDNFTAAAVFTTKQEYEAEIPTRLVELALDFIKEMRAAAGDTSFGDWTHGIAGGIAHGNSKGNVYIAGIEIGKRRFLVGVGEGFGRSTQAFADINPDANEIVVYEPDWQCLDEEYKCEFERATNRLGQLSTLYRISHQDDLWLIRGEKATRNKSISIPEKTGTMRHVAIKPHYR